MDVTVCDFVLLPVSVGQLACGWREQGRSPESGGTMKFVEEGGEGRGGNVASSEDMLEAGIKKCSHNK